MVFFIYKSSVVQYNEYYPFGLRTSSSWTRENRNNGFLYDEGSELNKTTGWYETPFRNYDTALGRLTSVDYFGNFENKSRYDHTSYWIGMRVMGVSYAFPVVGIVYGGA